jgi:hypothetical protein
MKIDLHNRITNAIFASIQFIMPTDKVELSMAQWKGIEKMQDLIFDLQTTVERLATDPRDQANAKKLSDRYQKILDQVHPERQEWKKNDTLDI